MWYCGNNLETSSNIKSDLIELPIVAFPILRLRKYISLDRIKSLLRNSKSAKDAFEAKIPKSRGGYISRLQYFFQREAQTWDYCLFTKGMHREFLKAIENQTDRNLFVLVGHPKSFVSSKGLEFLLKRKPSKYHV